MQLTLFAADTHASLSPQPGSDAARKMTATSGQNLCGSWLSSGPLGSLEKTLLGTSAWASTTCFLTWKEKVTPAGRLLFQLAPSVPTTGGTGCGQSGRNWWHTPRANDGQKRGNLGADDRSGLPAQTQHMNMWPTPNASDADKWSHQTLAERKAKGQQVRLNTAVSPEGGKGGPLNPEWVEGLMGFPFGWTDVSE